MGDVCTTVDKCIAKGAANNIFNLGTGKSITMLKVAEIVQKAWKEYFSDSISIEVNSSDTNIYDNTLKVSIEKLKGWIDFSPRDHMYDEALSIFKLLTDNR
jgi:hypothetical protein